MRTIEVQALRFGRPGGTLQDRYLVARGGDIRQVDVTALEGLEDFSHEAFLRRLHQLRYGASEAEVRAATEWLCRLVDAFVERLELGEGPVQIDLVTDFHELFAVPFELIRDADGQVLLGRPERAVELTRRFQRSSTRPSRSWPSAPRVLFAWAGDVPHQEHLDALLDALRPWVGPLEEVSYPVRDTRKVLTNLGNATLHDLARTCAGSGEGSYTHVHLLAHGARLDAQDDPLGQLASFGVRLGERVVGAEELAEALGGAGEQRPTVVTLAVCDAAGNLNTLLSTGGLAHELHRRGVPVVVGSQLPLSFEGSAIFARTFYDQLLRKTDDVRMALHAARVGLRALEDRHDWMALAAHVELPPDYVEGLAESSLRCELAQLETAARWAAHLLERPDAQAAPSPSVDLVGMLRERIDSLSSRFGQVGEASQELLLEKQGLLGSANKRLAELLFRQTSSAAAHATSQEDGHAALAEAEDWYLKAHDENLSHYWSGTQHLALALVRTGGIPPERVGHWIAARLAAENALAEAEGKDRLWPLGSLAELFLIAARLPDVGQKHEIGDALKAMGEFRDLAAKDGFELLSTRRQFQRYVTWWTAGNGYFAGGPDLSREAARLLDALEDPSAAASTDGSD